MFFFGKKLQRFENIFWNLPNFLGFYDSRELMKAGAISQLIICFCGVFAINIAD
jgi:hypothetical protein